MAPQNQNLAREVAPPSAPPHGAGELRQGDLQQAHLRQEFRYTSSSTAPSLNASVTVRCATPADLDAIMEIQSKSPADFQIRLSREQIERLVSNNQTLIAEFHKDGALTQAGAIFFTSATDLKTYQDALNPDRYDSQGSHLYDFWIVVHKERATSPEGTSVSTSLIKASDALAEHLDKDGVIAFSRAGGARPRFYRTLDQFARQAGEPTDSFLDIRPHFKAQLLINYILGCEPKARVEQQREIKKGDSIDIRTLSPEEMKEIRLDAILRWQRDARKGREVPNPSAHHFTDWLRSEHGGLFDEKILQLIERPDPSSEWNPLENPAFAPLAGALFRKFCDRGTHVPTDPALGSLHTRLGARFHGIALNSRPDDQNALSSNVLMSYEKVDIDLLIGHLRDEYVRTR